MRIGRHLKKLTKTPPQHELERLWKEANPDKVYDGYVEFHKMIEVLTKMLKEKCLYVQNKAKENGERVKFVHHQDWFPFFYRWENKKWKLIRRVEFEDFLSKYLSGTEVIALISLAELRSNALILFRYFHGLLTDLGLIEKEKA